MPKQVTTVAAAHDAVVVDVCIASRLPHATSESVEVDGNATVLPSPSPEALYVDSSGHRHLHIIHRPIASGDLDATLAIRLHEGVVPERLETAERKWRIPHGIDGRIPSLVSMPLFRLHPMASFSKWREETRG